MDTSNSLGNVNQMGHAGTDFTCGQFVHHSHIRDLSSEFHTTCAKLG